MLKKILTLKNIKKLNKREQNTIHGGHGFTCLATSKDYDGSGCFCGVPPGCTFVATSATCSDGSQPYCP